jgi:hypothetical protein
VAGGGESNGAVTVDTLSLRDPHGTAGGLIDASLPLAGIAFTIGASRVVEVVAGGAVTDEVAAAGRALPPAPLGRAGGVIGASLLLAGIGFDFGFAPAAEVGRGDAATDDVLVEYVSPGEPPVAAGGSTGFRLPFAVAAAAAVGIDTGGATLSRVSGFTGFFFLVEGPFGVGGVGSGSSVSSLSPVSGRLSGDSGEAGIFFLSASALSFSSTFRRASQAFLYSAKMRS